MWGAPVRLFALVLTMGLVAASAATQDGWTGNGFLSLNGSYQVSDRTFELVTTSELYDELAEFTSEPTSSSGGVIDVAAGFRLIEGLAIAINFTSFDTTGLATTTGAVPHPLLVNRPRSVSFEQMDLARRELGYHFQAYYLIPVTERFALAVFGGPSMIRLEQDLVDEVSIAEMGPPFTAVTVTGVSTVRATGTRLGGNLGADVSYRFNSAVGVGFTLKYIGGSIDLAETMGDESLEVGGVQFGGGLRVFF